MNLVYLWVENYRCFHETGIHFTNKYEIEVEIGGKSSDSAAAEETPGRGKTSETYLVNFKTREHTLSAKDFYGKQGLPAPKRLKKQTMRRRIPARAA